MVPCAKFSFLAIFCIIIRQASPPSLPSYFHHTWFVNLLIIFLSWLLARRWTPAWRTRVWFWDHLTHRQAASITAESSLLDSSEFWIGGHCHILTAGQLSCRYVPPLLPFHRGLGPVSADLPYVKQFCQFYLDKKCYFLIWENISEMYLETVHKKNHIVGHLGYYLLRNCNSPHNLSTYILLISSVICSSSWSLFRICNHQLLLGFLVFSSDIRLDSTVLAMLVDLCKSRRSLLCNMSHIPLHTSWLPDRTVFQRLNFQTFIIYVLPSK